MASPSRSLADLASPLRGTSSQPCPLDEVQVPLAAQPSAFVLDASIPEEIQRLSLEQEVDTASALLGGAPRDDGLRNPPITRRIRLLGRSVGSLVVCWALTMAASVAGMMYIYMCGWYVFFRYGREPCDWPVASWLLVMQLVAPFYFARGCIRPLVYRMLCGWTPDSPNQPEPWRVKLLVYGFCFLCYFLVFSGGDLVREASSCRTTAPHLFRWVSYLFPSGIVHFIGLQFLAICSSAAVLAAVGLRLSESSGARAADPAVLQMLPSLSVDSTMTDKQCSICLDDFVEGQRAKELICCKNIIHESCLDGWLQLRRTCPLCRKDLQVEVGVSTSTEESMAELLV